MIAVFVALTAGPPASSSADLQAMQGTWVLVAESLEGSPIAKPNGSFTVVIEGSQKTVMAGSEVTARWEVALDPLATPKRMNSSGDGKTLAEIYRLEGEELTIAFRNRWNDPRRPTDFEPSKGIGIYVLKRKQ